MEGLGMLLKEAMTEVALELLLPKDLFLPATWSLWCDLSLDEPECLLRRSFMASSASWLSMPT